MPPDAFWYLWRLTAANDYMPESIGCLRTTADAVEVVSLDDEAALAALDRLERIEGLKLRYDRREGEGEAAPIATYERIVSRGEEGWPEAVVFNLAATTGLRVTTTQDFYGA